MTTPPKGTPVAAIHAYATGHITKAKDRQDKDRQDKEPKR